MTVEEFVHKTLELLQEEREAEIQETRLWQESVSLKQLQSTGVCLLKLQVVSQVTGLYGRTVLQFEPRKRLGVSVLPSNNFSPGDIVGLYDGGGGGGGCGGASSRVASGIVTRVAQASLSVAFDDDLSVDTDSLYNLLKLANDVTYKRMKTALNSLNGNSHGPAAALVAVLFGDARPSTLRRTSDEIKFLNPNLDESQRDAVSFALSQKELAIIHGPPGTGKTTTVTEVVLQLVQQGLKVLCCASSNVAVDNLVERLVRWRARVVRLGHPARLLESIQSHSLDAILAKSDNADIITDIRRDMDRAIMSLKKHRGERSDLRRELGELRKELRTREAAAISQILKNADVVLSTNIGACGEGPLRQLAPDHFDCVVIDECAQALEGSCWIPLLLAPRCVLAGDYKQLPPTIKSPSAASGGLALSLMERLIRLHGDAVVRMLTVQYRMNSAIMDWASKEMYEGRLRAHGSVEEHLLKDLPGVADVEETGLPLLLIDTAGCGLNETDDPDELSKGNSGEVDIVELHIKTLTDAGVKDKDIAVIAPYNLQVDLLRQRLSSRHPHLEIKSVDGFQGREKEAVVLSLVRSNRKGEVGFLAENRRLNVAVTRARRHITVVCDSQTVQNDPFLKSLLEHMTQRGEVRTAFEYLHDIVPQNYTRQGKDAKANAAAKTSSSSQQKTKHAPSNKTRPDRADPHKKEESSSKNHKQFTKEEDESRASDIRKQLETFKNDKNQTELQFPPSLNSHERMLVHRTAEEMGLQHESRGEGKERCVSVSKELATKHQTKEEEEEKRGETEEEEQFDLPQKDKENQTVPDPGSKTSVDLKRLHLERMKREQQKREENAKHKKQQNNVQPTQPQPKKSAKAKKQTKSGACEIAAAASSDSDFDALIDAVVKADAVCSFIKCKTSVLTLGQMCVFCNRLYCLSHHVPEVHGCGERAKAHARMRISREGVLYAGSGKKDSSLDPNKKAHLQRKLDSKLKDLATQRKSKSKDKDS
ncbi:hypothetical protein NL108_018485 [Boleophthalmus pectinirostris]|uniref:DNA-binding protein SMUBP-2 n=1 Tax=Boleophthalmus pectinirostris TaxID=150288 RepID=UPI00242CDE2B|nr:DNA-binding protein SMUBP-2 [Boleophthalmus pectinirostris]XP_020793637.2 DNA-binding protein SMUBP-2 [Boleophthalmus pectinirostris]KAJ0069990.1 hypothetical protein NL108_018485 [Boleophthalmus pectinirostris]